MGGTLLGFPDPGQPRPTFTAGSGVSAFDIPGISASIDRAIAALRPDQHGRLVIQVDQSGGGAGLVIRLPVPVVEAQVVGIVTKPLAGRWGWSLQAGATFLVGEAPVPVRVAPSIRGFYRLFRYRGDNPAAAAIKAYVASKNRPVRLT